MEKFEIIELLIDDNKIESGINAVSVVESPAIEENFVALKKHEVELKEVDAEKRILMGAALIPNKQIYRKNKDKEFYIYFSEDTVRKASELFLMRANQNNATLEHEKKLVQNLHRIMATLCREGGFMGYFPKKYDGASHQERAELLKANAKIGDVWGVVSFFLLSSESYLKVLSDYSKHLTKGMQGQ